MQYGEVKNPSVNQGELLAYLLSVEISLVNCFLRYT